MKEMLRCILTDCQMIYRWLTRIRLRLCFMVAPIVQESLKVWIFRQLLMKTVMCLYLNAYPSDAGEYLHVNLGWGGDSDGWYYRYVYVSDTPEHYKNKQLMLTVKK